MTIPQHYQAARNLGYTASAAMHIARESVAYGRVINFAPLYPCWRRLTGTAR